jgi:hypothetical protein
MEDSTEGAGIPISYAVESVESSVDLKDEKVEKVIAHEDDEDEFDLVSYQMYFLLR